jgi:hypothetical protein
MARIFLTSVASDVSGYNLALVDSRNSGSTALVTSVTATAASGTKIAMTKTSGGTTLKWITKPLRKAVTISAVPAFVTCWAKEDNAAANTSFGFDLFRYTSGAEWSTSFLAYANTTEVTTTAANTKVVTGNLTASTASTFAAGDRLVIKGYVVNVGTMAVSHSFTMDYDGPTMGADGDTNIVLNEDFPVKRQFLGPVPLGGQFAIGKGDLMGVVDRFNQYISGQICNAEEPIQVTLDRFTDEINNR